MSETPIRVMISCPGTGAEVSTRLRLRPTAFEALTGEYAFRCAGCGEVHRWRREDAWLKPDGPRGKLTAGAA